MAKQVVAQKLKELEDEGDQQNDNDAKRRLMYGVETTTTMNVEADDL